MPQRTIAIGDVHGCSQALAALLEAIAPTEHDTIVTLGDYVDRGPDSRGVIDQMLALRERVKLVPLIGNHERMMLDAIDLGGDRLQFWLACGGRETLESYGRLKSVPAAHVEFLRELAPHYETAEHIFVHANYHYKFEMDQQPEFLTLWEHLTSEPSPHVSGKTVFVGHTPQITGEVLDLGHVVCLDTACAMGGVLTAMDVNSRQLWHADAEGNRL